MQAVTFTRTARTVDDAGGGSTVTETTIAASAVQVRANAREESRFAEGNLVRERTVVLLTSAETYGARIEPGDTVVWPQGGTDYTWTVKFVDEIAPDGYAIISRAVVTR